MSAKLYVGNIPFTATKDEILDFFHDYKVENVAICFDRETKRPRGFAFVTIDDDAAAEKAISELDGLDFGGRRAVVNRAIEKQKGDRPQQAAVPRGNKPRSPQNSNGGDGSTGNNKKGGRKRGPRMIVNDDGDPTY